MDAACGRFAQRVPLLANMVEGGKTPVQGVDELEARGFRIVIFPGGTARAVGARAGRLLREPARRTAAPRRGATGCSTSTR